MIKSHKFAYCDNCEKEVKAKRKPIDNLYINIWIIAIISSLGLGIIPFLIYRYIVMKKNICSKCNSQIEFYTTREEIPEPKAQIARILKSIEDEKNFAESDEEDLTFCPFCQVTISKQIKVCSNCGSSLEE